MANQMISDHGNFNAEQFGDEPIVIICDHASNKIPDEFDCLGLPDDLLDTHIAWDIGARELAKSIAQKLKCAIFQCGVSRLVVDVNRSVDAVDVIPERSDQIPIPGNQNLSAASIEDRIIRYHEPYHKTLSKYLTSISDGGPIFVVSIHSFTKRLMGSTDERPWPVGLLWNEDEVSAQAAITFLRDKMGEPIGDNEPYDAREFNYTIDTHAAPYHWPHLTFEIRQDRLGTPKLTEIIANHLVGAIRAARKNRL